jgi:hypothetical protein
MERSEIPASGKGGSMPGLRTLGLRFTPSQPTSSPLRFAQNDNRLAATNACRWASLRSAPTYALSANRRHSRASGNDELCLPPKPIPIPTIPVPALHSRPAQAAQSSALRNPAFAPLKGKEKISPLSRSRERGRGRGHAAVGWVKHSETQHAEAGIAFHSIPAYGLTLHLPQPIALMIALAKWSDAAHFPQN